MFIFCFHFNFMDCVASAEQLEYDGNETGEEYRKGRDWVSDCEYSKS